MPGTDAYTALLAKLHLSAFESQLQFLAPHVEAFVEGNFQTRVTYGFAFFLPLFYIALKATSGSYGKAKEEIEGAGSTGPAAAEEDEKAPLKSVMPPPAAQLDPPKDDVYTLEQLAEYNGTNGKGIYVAIKGTIFDVSKKADVYGPGGSYSIFAGKDGSRGLGMSSLKPEDAVADYSTLPANEMKVLNDWYAYYSKRYNVVGRVASA